MKNVKWIESLNIDIDQFNSWVADKPEDCSPTYWCLLNKKLDKPTYLSWAKSFYKLPVMNANYQKFPIDPSFWQQIKTISNWSKQMVPLYFWDNILFVLVTEPLDVTWSIPVKYIIGTPEQMIFFWNKLSGEPELKTQPIIAAINTPIEASQTKPKDEPAQKTPNIEPVNILENTKHSAPDITELTSVDQEPTYVPAQTVEPVQALKVEPEQALQIEPAQNMDLLNLGSENIVKVDPVKTADSADNNLLNFDDLKQTSSAGMEGLNLSSEATNSSAMDGLDLSLLNLSETSDNSLFNIAGNNQPATDAVIKEQAVTNTTQNPQDMSDLSVNTESLRLDRVELIAAEEQDNNKNQVNFTLTQSNVSTAKDLNSFKDINKNFKQSLVFTLTQDKVSVTHQDGSWNLSGADQLTIKRDPSLFKFCLLSRMPFHGVISDKDSMKSDLFRTLNIRNSKEHITLMPIVNHHGQVNHFILAVSDGMNLNHLSELQKSLPAIQEEITA